MVFLGHGRDWVSLDGQDIRADAGGGFAEQKTSTFSGGGERGRGYQQWWRLNLQGLEVSRVTSQDDQIIGVGKDGYGHAMVL